MTLFGRFFVLLSADGWRAALSGVTREPGIYRILNVRTGRSYVGSAKSIRDRWRGHIAALLRNKSGNTKLRRTWTKHGSSAFRFEVLEIVPDSRDLIDREQYWVERLDSVDAGYNCRPHAKSNLGIRYPPAPQSRRDRISAALKGKRVGIPPPIAGKRHRPESCASMSRSKRAMEANFISHGGVSMCLSDWADRIGITVRGLGNRLRRGWPLERALSEASRGY